MSKVKRDRNRSGKAKKRFMANFTGPLQIPDLEQLVADAVKHFAKSRDLEYELWYHDEPLWLVRKRGDKITRSLQIGAYVPTAQKGASAPRLFFIPNAYFFDETQLKSFTVPQDTVIKHLHSKLVEEIVSDGRPQAMLEGILKDAWNDVENFNESNLKEPAGEIPPKP